MEELINILEELKPGVDYYNTDKLIDDHILDSLTILSLVSEIEDTFDVEIPTVEIIPNNFNSAKNIYALIEKLQNE